MSVNTQLQIKQSYLDHTPRKKGLLRKSGGFVKTSIESRTYKEILWGSIVTGKSVGFCRNIRNLGVKFQEAFRPTGVALEGATMTLPAGSTAVQGVSRLQSVSQLLLRVVRSLFIFRIPKTVYDFTKNCVELSKHKDSSRRHEMQQAAFGLVDNTGDLIGYSADAAGTLVAFNVISSASAAWAPPVMVAGALLNAAGVVGSGIQFQESVRFYQQMNKTAQKSGKDHYEVHHLVDLYALIKEKEKEISKRFISRHFVTNSKDFHLNMQRISSVVASCQNASSEKQAAAKEISNKVIKGLKQRVSTRMTAHIISMLGSITGIFASICLGAFIFAAPAVVLTMTIIGLSLLITSLGLGISRMIYERVEQGRLTRVFNQALEQVSQIDPKKDGEAVKETPLDLKKIMKRLEKHMID